MPLDRRDFLAGTGLAVAAGTLLRDARAQEERHAPASTDWADVRGAFALSEDVVHMSALLLASHPQPVREAIERHRRGLDADPVIYLERHNTRLTRAAREAAGRYLDAPASAIALTDSTTMGIGLVYNGLRLAPGDEVITTTHDYYATHEALRIAAERSGATVKRITLFERSAEANADEIVARIVEAVTPATRVVALTWVHSSSGVKLPLRPIADALGEINAGRDAADHALLCVDAVHGFGNQAASFPELGCDVLFAGCHKWLFGPRGTGIVVATDQAWAAMTPTIPTFAESASWRAWMTGEAPDGPTNAARMAPGGFKPFEHVWALPEAFDFHERIGKARVAAHTAALAGELKEGLAAMRGVTLQTPMSTALSAGIVCFDVEGQTAAETVTRLRERRIIASVTPYARAHARLTPSIVNTPEEIDTVLRAVREIAA